ncbi:hypothetical protein LBMAG27_22720 [Bacteroidota bacterium]|nr:hypothetical protein LBMAG27_22720 [Bacteroidota bacterium]
MYMYGTCICASGFYGVDCSTFEPVKKNYKVTCEIGCGDFEVIYNSDSAQTSATEYHKNNSWSYTFYRKKNQVVLLFAYNSYSVAQGDTATIKLNYNMHLRKLIFFWLKNFC